MIEQVLRRRRSWSPVQCTIVVWTVMVAASILATLVTHAPVPPFLAVLLFRPFTVLAVALASAACLSVILKSKVESVWNDVVTFFPFAVLGAVILAWFGIWNDGSGGVPLGLGQAGLFIVTGGIAPFVLGPEILLRATFVVLAILLAIGERKKGALHGRSIAVGVVFWIASAVSLLVQSWMAQFASIANQNGIAMVAQDAARSLGIAHVSSYWSNYQADRFFAGVGNQLITNISLSSSAILFLVGIVALIVIASKAQPWSRPGMFRVMLRRVVAFPFSFVVGALVIGLSVGWSAYRSTWNAVDVIAVLLFVVTCVLFMVWDALRREIDNLPIDEQRHPDRPLPSGLVAPDDVASLASILLIAIAVGSWLLGWPVAIALWTAVAVVWLSSPPQFGWSQTVSGRMAVSAVVAAAVVVAGGAFAARTAMVPEVAYRWALAWGIWVAATSFLLDVPFDQKRKLLPFQVVGVAGILFAVILQLPIILAVLALFGLFLFWLQNRPEKWGSWIGPGMLVFGGITLILAVFIHP